MGSDDVIPFPIKSLQRHKNKAGRHAVLCIVSDRRLQFPKQASACLPDGEAIRLHVVTVISGKGRILCELIVTREDLLRAIAAVAPAAIK